MKACIIQPYYSYKQDDLEKCYNDMVKLIDECDDSLDIIVLPEYCDVPALTDSDDDFYNAIQKYNTRIKEKVIETAKRCKAVVFANFFDKTETGYRNTTHAIDKAGNIVAKYYKVHPAPSEIKNKYIDTSYMYEKSEPYTVDINGVRYGFMTCYDFYFYEDLIPLARKNVDVIIGCSHQRSDTHSALEIIGKFFSYQTNAYLLRSAVSLGEGSEICGCSMAVAPDGTMLADMKSKIGKVIVEFDPHKKYYKPAGFGGKMKSHYEYVDEGRF